MEPFRIVAVGWRREDLTLGACGALRGADSILLRTGQCACADWLEEAGIPFDTTDCIYETSRDFVGHHFVHGIDAVLERRRYGSRVPAV